jgi:hypothetical protein
MGLRLFFRCKPFDLNIEKTDAESVEDIVDAISKLVVNPIGAVSDVAPKTQ